MVDHKPIPGLQHLDVVQRRRTDTNIAQRRTMVVLVAAQICTAAAMAIGVSVAGLIAADLAGNQGAAGAAQTVSVLGAALVAVPMGRIAASSGRRPALLAGLLLALGGGLTVIMAAAVRSLPLLLIGLLAFGAASAVNLQARYAATDLAPHDQVARSLAVVVWASTIGTVVGPNLAGPTDRVGTALSLPELSGPFAFSVVSLAGASAIMTCLPHPARSRAASGPDGDTAVASARPGLRAAARAAFDNPVTRTALAVIAVSHAAMIAVMSITPAQMRHTHHAMYEGTATDQHVLTLVGIVISLHTLGMFAFSPLIGRLADKIGTGPVITAGLGTLTVGAGLAAVAGPSVPLLSVGLFLLGLGWSCGLIGGSAQLSVSAAPALRPAVQGISDMFMNAAGAVGGALAGVIVATTSYAVLGMLTAGLVAVVTATSLYNQGRPTESKT